MHLAPMPSTHLKNKNYSSFTSYTTVKFFNKREQVLVDYAFLFRTEQLTQIQQQNLDVSINLQSHMKVHLSQTLIHGASTIQRVLKH